MYIIDYTHTHTHTHIQGQRRRAATRTRVKAVMGRDFFLHGPIPKADDDPGYVRVTVKSLWGSEKITGVAAGRGGGLRVRGGGVTHRALCRRACACMCVCLWMWICLVLRMREVTTRPMW